MPLSRAPSAGRMSSQLLIQHVPGGVADDVAVDAFFGVPETPYAHPTVRAVREDINSSAAADHTANIPATAQTGDLVVIALANNAGTQTLPPTGWTVVETEYTQANPKYGVIYRVRQGGDPSSVTLTKSAVNSTSITLVIQANNGGTLSLDGTPTKGTDSTNSNAMTAASVTTTVDDTLLIYGGAINSSTQSLNPTGAMTEAFETSGTKKQSLNWEAFATAGATGTRTLVASSSSLAWASVLFAVKEVAGGGDTPVSANDTETLDYVDTASADAAITAADTETLNYTDTATLATALTATDTETLDYVDTVSIAVSVADTQALTAVDTTEVALAKTATDTETLDYTDTATLAAAITAADTETLNYTDTATLAAALTAADTETLDYTDTASLGLTATDSETLDYSDTATLAAALTATDSETLNYAETAALALTASDTETLDYADTATVDVAVTAADTQALTAFDTASLANLVVRQRAIIMVG
jgi:hypothetical protein